jgi:hypothetical protein
MPASHFSFFALRSLRLLVALTLASYAAFSSAQLAPADPDWKEADTPPPPAFELARLVPFDVSVNSSMKWGIDPQAMTIGKDSVIRYVVVAQSPSGVMNAMYEGIRCATGDFKTYARYNKDSGWNTVAQPQWQPFLGTHAHRLARQGVCTNSAPAQSVREVVQTMRQTSEKPR